TLTCSTARSSCSPDLRVVQFLRQQGLVPRPVELRLGPLEVVPRPLEVVPPRRHRWCPPSCYRWYRMTRCRQWWGCPPPCYRWSQRGTRS
ncbi:MAG: hypothetical protein ACREMG_11110, partial [Gemmatimonadales bacterium]